MYEKIRNGKVLKNLSTLRSCSRFLPRKAFITVKCSFCIGSDVHLPLIPTCNATILEETTANFSKKAMKIKDGNAGIISNFEVLNLLLSKGATQEALGSLGSVASSECKVFDYLLKSPACNQTRECVQEFLKKTEKFGLTKAEKLQVLNLRPSTAVEVYLIIEDCEERLSDAVVEEFIATVNSVLPPSPIPPIPQEEENAQEHCTEMEDDNSDN